MVDKITKANSLLKEVVDLLNPQVPTSLSRSRTQAGGECSSATTPFQPPLVLSAPVPGSTSTSNFNVQELLHPRVTSRRRSIPYEKKRAVITWTHKFVCLGQTNVETAPNPQDKYTLKCANLGEKKLVFKLNGNYAHVKEVILQAFPSLEEAGGFELSRTNGPYSKELVPINASYLSSVSRLKNFVDQARVYIRPLQANIVDIFGQPCDKIDEEPKEKCLECGKEFDLSYLKTHVEVCKEAALAFREEKERESNSDEFDLPPALTSLSSSMKLPSQSKESDDSVCLSAPSVPCTQSSSQCFSQSLPAGYSAYIDLTDEDLPDDDPELQEAIEASLVLPSCSESATPKASVACILQEHVRSVNLSTDFYDPHQLITVRRKHVWDDIKRCFSKPYTNLSLPLRVSFVGEPASDEGGPKREFFRLAIESCMNDPSLFCGPAFSKVPLKNTSAVLHKHFKYVGNLIAMSLVQGGPAPHCFASWVFEYVANGLEGMQFEDNDVVNSVAKEFLEQISKVNNVDTLRSILSEADIVFESGFSKPTHKVTLDDIPIICKLVQIHLLVVPIKAEMDEIKDGLSLFGIDRLASKLAFALKKLFVFSVQLLSLSVFVSLFEYQYASVGSNAREKEEATAMHWNELLMEVENKMADCNICSMDGDTENRLLTLEDILIFVSGANRVPPTGFEKPITISFNNSSMYPTASTCALTLFLPTKYAGSYSDFKKAMIEGLVSGFGFGQP